MPEDFCDFLSVIKFLLPAIIGAIVSLMAYFIARTQRAIAYNKYNLDLFDKRFEAYQEFMTEFHTLFEILNKDRSKVEKLPDFSSLITPLLKCSILFPRYYKNGIDSDIYLQQTYISKRTEYEMKRDYQQKRLDQSLRGSGQYQSISNEITELNQKIADIDWSMVTMCNNSLDYMKSHLNISHRPY